MKHLLTEKLEVINSKAANRGRLTNDAVERDNNMTDQPSAQQTVGSFKETTHIKLLFQRLNRLPQRITFNFPATFNKKVFLTQTTIYS